MLLIPNLILSILLLAFGIYLLMIAYNKIKIKDNAANEKMRSRSGLLKIIAAILIVSAIIAIIKIVEFI